jgi:hypothetical protein
VPYGTSNKPNSSHYTDQMELYVGKQTKQVSISKAIFSDKKYKSYNDQKHMNSITLVNRKSITINWVIDNHQKRNQTK